MPKKLIQFIFILIALLYATDVKAGIILRPVLNTGLVGYWDFQEGSSNYVYDKSGYRNNGVISGTVNYTNGKIGNGLLFAGTSYADCASMSNAGELRITGSLTISAWVKDYDINDDWYLGKADYDAGTWSYLMAATTDNVVKQFAFLVDGATTGIRYTKTTVQDNIWYHVVGVYNSSAGTLKIYLNGVDDTGTLSGTIPASIEDTSAHFRIPGESGPFEGEIDEVRIYNRVLSESEIERLYKLSQPKINTSQNNIVTNGLVGFWSFNGSDMESGIAFDRSGQGNDGTITGATPTIGKVGQALSFDGTDGGDDYINTLLDNQLDGINKLTISAWMKRDANGIGIMVGRESDGFVDGLNIQFGSNDSYAYFMPANPGYGRVAFNESGWHHFVMVFDGTLLGDENRLKGYIDGAQRTIDFTSPGVSATTETMSNSFLIGLTNINVHNIKGSVDEVRVYNRALEQSEITVLYQSGLAKISASQNTQITNGLVGFWSFNGPDIDGNTAYDRSGQGNNGTLSAGGYATPERVNQNGGHVNGEYDLSVILTDAVAGDVIVITGARTYWKTDHNIDAANFSGSNVGDFHVVITEHDDDSAYDVEAVIAWTTVSANGNATVTLTPDDTGDGGFYITMALAEYSGLDTSNPAESYNSDVGNTSLPATGNIYPTIDSVLVGMVTHPGGNTITENPAYDEIYDQTNSSDLMAEACDRVVSAGTYSIPWTLTPSYDHWTAIGASFKANNLGNGPQKTNGKVGQALDFNGSGNGINLSSPTSLDDIETKGGGGMSVSAWVYPNIETASQMIVSKNFLNSGSWGFYLSSNGSWEILRFAKDYSGVDLDVYTEYGDVVANEWQHVAMTWDGSSNANNVHLYVNGVDETNTRTSGTVTKNSDASNTMYIGRYGGSDSYFNGKIDEVRIYNRVLEPEEVKRLYNLGR